MQYKQTVASILNLEWSNLDTGRLLDLMVLSAYTASEFAESLRLALAIYPKHEGLRQMAEGELMTNNLRFKGYAQRNDHAAFLWHFLRKEKLLKAPAPFQAHGGDPDWVVKCCEKYHREVRLLSPKIRAMSIFSREKELPEIFKRVLTAKDSAWEHPALEAFRYYLERHIELDTAPDGHQTLVSNFPVTDKVDAYYQIRYRLYDWTIFDHESPGD